MKRFNRISVLILLLVGIFLLTGCNKFKSSTFNGDQEDTSSKVTVVPDDTTGDSEDSNQDKSDESKPTPAMTVTQAVKIPVDVELQIYTVNDSSNLEPIIALVPNTDEITPELIVEKVVESLEDQSIVIGIDSVDTEKDAVIVSFQKDKAPYTNMGSEFEGNILNAFAQSLIDNIDTVKKVIYRIEGEAYASGSYEYGIDEPYMSD